ncbi:MAG: helix-turn-helix transcriptional regulator [Clostridia bacterium]|nr:helix-turn-helix transcriptional regulator [Clostridia bacterium]
MVYNFENLSFSSVSVFRSRHKDGVFNVQPRPYGALAFRLEGESVFTFSNKTITAMANNVSFIPANLGYKLNSKGSIIIVIHLHNCNYDEPENFSIENTAVLKSLFLKAVETYSQYGSVNKVKAIVYEILDRIEEEQKRTYQNSAFQKCLNYLENNYQNAMLDVQEIANVGYMSKSTLQRAFNNYLGVSPKAYLIKVRLNKAFELLMQCAKSVKEIAFLCGFSDEKFFSRIFKQKYGYSPSEVKKV